LPWIAAQFWATLLLILAGLAWTRLPDKHGWQVVLSLLIPLLLLAAALVLEVGTMRRLVNQDQDRRPFTVGALMLLGWIVLVWLAWTLLGWCDDQVPLWAGYLNSKSPSAARARLFSYEHLQLWLTGLVWIFRWIVVPGKVIPHAVASAQWGWRLPWRKVWSVLLNWRWWLAVVLAALLGVALTVHFFSGEPHGTAARQVWAVVLKLGGAYLLAVASWVFVLAWAAVLVARTPQPAGDGLDLSLRDCLRASEKWIVGWAGWTAASMLFDFIVDALPEKLRTSGWADAPVVAVLLVSAFLLQVGMIRAMRREEKQARLVWAALGELVWLIAAIGLWFLANLWHGAIAEWLFDWIVVPALLIPFLAASAWWGLKLPWHRVFQVVVNWRWWTGIVVAVVLGKGLPEMIQSVGTGGESSPKAWVNIFWNDVPGLLTMALWIVLMAWFVALLSRTKPLAAETAGSSLPETRDDASRNA
jgi:hypothetical protein